MTEPTGDAPISLPRLTQRPIEAAQVEERTDSEEALMLDPRSLDKEYHYRWVHTRPQRQTRMLAKGYTYVDKEEDGVIPLVEQPGAGDSKIYNGDTVLMKIPKGRHLAGRKRIAETTRARLAAPVASFRKKAEGAGVELSNKEMKA